MKENQSFEEKEKVHVGPVNPIWRTVCDCLFAASLIGFLTILATGSMYKLFSKSGFGGLLKKLSDSTTIQVKIAITSVTIIIFSLFVITFMLKLKVPKFDDWVKEIAYKRLSSTYIFYDRKNIYIEYDVGLKKKDIMEFITEITDKSEYYTYYLDEIMINKGVVKIAIHNKQPIPKRCEIDKSKDTIWNVIPMGEATNNKTMKIAPVGWYLNDNNVDKEMVETLPSTSLVIAGGTGSGKSVVENGIIGHITRHSDHIQGLLVDVKKVEFGGLESFKGIKKVGLTVSECADILKQARAIMYDRFDFMEKQGVNNVYKVDTIVDYYTINGKDYQFDEIFNVTIDGKMEVLTLDKIYEAVQEGKDVEVKDWDVLPN